MKWVRLLAWIEHKVFWNSIRSSDVFIVSYPKSGATWLAFMIGYYLYPDANIHLKNSTKYVPDINKLYKGKFVNLRRYLKVLSVPAPRFFRVHATYTERFSKVIYLLRDPRDVMVSYWHYHRMRDAHFSLDLKEFVERFDMWPCSWDEHVSQWLLEHRVFTNQQRILRLSYERIHRNPALALECVLRFAGIPVDPTKVRHAVEQSRFERMKKLEQEYGTAEHKAREGERFVRKGKVGGWRDELDEETLKVIEQKFGSVMKAVGYAVDSNEL